MNAPLDIALHDQGTIVGIEPRSAAGREWCSTNIDAPAYACAGRVIWADHRPAQDIINGAEADGLKVGAA